MPYYQAMNYLEAKSKLPSFYWDAHTKMNCLQQYIKETKQNAYAHYIQRLMVLGNFALLLFDSGVWMILHNDNKVVKLSISGRYSIFSFCGVLSVLASSTTFATIFFIKISMDIKKAVAITSVYGL